MCGSKVVFQTSRKRVNGTMGAVSGSCIVGANLILILFIIVFWKLVYERISIQSEATTSLELSDDKVCSQCLVCTYQGSFLGMNKRRRLIDFINIALYQFFGKRRLCMRRSVDTIWSTITKSWTIIIVRSLIRPACSR